MRFLVHNFKHLAKKRGKKLHTPTLQSHGHGWFLEIYPQGCCKSDESITYVSIYLNRSDAGEGTTTPVMAKFTIELSPSFSKLFSVIFSGNTKNWGLPDFAKRADVLSSCVDTYGTLVIDVHLQIYTEKKRIWYPKVINNSDSLGRELLESSAEADITFVVGDEEGKILAHKSILCLRSPVLYGIAQSTTSHDEEVLIPDISGSTFKILLEFIYVGTLPKSNDVETSKTILVGADRFGLVQLKLQIESEITAKFLDAGNAAELLLFADGHSCPLLKEACMKLHGENQIETQTSPEWPKVMEASNLLAELFFFVTSQKRTPQHPDDFDNMPVHTLREKLEFLGLDLDGTREMLVERLRDHHEDIDVLLKATLGADM